jgi:hypothetical protein
VIERVFRVGDAPGHRRRTGTVILDKAHRMAAGLGIQNVVDVALAPDADILGAMLGNAAIAHAGEELAQLFRLRMGELDEFETIGTGRVFNGDAGRRVSCGKGPIVLSSERHNLRP